MPGRYLREGIIHSARVNALSMGAEVFYRRLMSVVDDHGRYHALVVTLRGACWPTKSDKIRDSDVSKWLTELVRGDEPLVKIYNVGGAPYLEIQNFGQATRSKSKFPDPPWAKPVDNRLANAKQMHTSAEQMLSLNDNDNDNDIRERETRTSGVVVLAPAEWKSDPVFLEFKALYEASGGSFVDDDWHKAFQFVWKKLDWEQRKERIDAVKVRIWGDPRYVHRPENFLRSEWKRAPPAATNPRDRLVEEAKAYARERSNRPQPSR